MLRRKAPSRKTIPAEHPPPRGTFRPPAPWPALPSNKSRSWDSRELGPPLAQPRSRPGPHCSSQGQSQRPQDQCSPLIAGSKPAPEAQGGPPKVADQPRFPQKTPLFPHAPAQPRLARNSIRGPSRDRPTQPNRSNPGEISNDESHTFEMLCRFHLARWSQARFFRGAQVHPSAHLHQKLLYVRLR